VGILIIRFCTTHVVRIAHSFAVIIRRSFRLCRCTVTFRLRHALDQDIRQHVRWQIAQRLRHVVRRFVTRLELIPILRDAAYASALQIADGRRLVQFGIGHEELVGHRRIDGGQSLLVRELVEQGRLHVVVHDADGGGLGPVLGLDCGANPACAVARFRGCWPGNAVARVLPIVASP